MHLHGCEPWLRRTRREERHFADDQAVHIGYAVATPETRHLPLEQHIALALRERIVDLCATRRALGAGKWFFEHPGWQLTDSQGVARLIKTPARAGPGQGIPLLQSALDYEILIRVLWFGGKTGADQFILSHLLEEITAAAGETPDGARLHRSDATWSTSHNVPSAAGVSQPSVRRH